MTKRAALVISLALVACHATSRQETRSNSRSADTRWVHALLLLNPVGNEAQFAWIGDASPLVLRQADTSAYDKLRLIREKTKADSMCFGIFYEATIKIGVQRVPPSGSTLKEFPNSHLHLIYDVVDYRLSNRDAKQLRRLLQPEHLDPSIECSATSAEPSSARPLAE